MKYCYSLFLLLNLALQSVCQWNPDGYDTRVCITQDTYSSLPQAVSDGSGGTITIFENHTFYGAQEVNEGSIKAQRVDANGYLKWGTYINPRTISGFYYEQDLCDLIADGNGGAFITWIAYQTFEDRSGDKGELFVQHINNNGVSLWNPVGIKVSSSEVYGNSYSRLCLDNTGGVFVTWLKIGVDDSNSPYIEAFVQHLNNNGSLLWNSSGIEVSTVPAYRLFPQIVPDGVGGAIISFVDLRNGDVNFENGKLNNTDIYAQRFDGAGNRLWTNEGTVVCNAPYNQLIEVEERVSNRMVSDGAGGAILVFDDYRQFGNNSSNDLYAQRINGQGVRLWNEDGLLVKTSQRSKYDANVRSDGLGGMVLIWYERSASTTDFIYAQQVTSTGTKNWSTSGALLDDIDYSNTRTGEADITPDGTGNYIASWTMYDGSSSTAPSNIRAQKLNALGQALWANFGVIVNTVDGYASDPKIVPADNGECIIVWRDERENGGDIFANKLLSDGSIVQGSLTTSFVSLANGNWNDPSIWSGGVIPSANFEVTINHNVSVTTDATCLSLTVQPPGNLILLPGVRLTITDQ